jgi:ribonuclease HI
MWVRHLVGPQNEDTDLIEFNPQVTMTGDLGDVFRIFTQPEITPDVRQTAPEIWQSPDPDAETATVYTDGLTSNNGGENPNAGAGVFYGEGDARNRAIRVPIELNPSNQVGEILSGY